VLAAGAWCARLAAGIGLERPLFPLRRTVIRATGAPPADHPWVWIDDVGLYVRPHGEEWWVSACDEAVAFPADRPGSREEALPAMVELARAKIGRWLPALAGSALIGGWSGLRTFAPDRRPVLGPDPERPGLWWVAGLGGYGVSCAYAAGEAVACWVRGEPTPWLRPSAVSPGRPYLRRWPIRPLGDIAGSVLISGTLDP
jgi:D-arginine dehydrogenase